VVLFSYLFTSFQTQNFKTEIKFKNPSTQLFEPYDYLSDKNNDIASQFISDFELNFLSLDNVESSLDESQNFDNFKGYLK
jgi:hypothetical protein